MHTGDFTPTGSSQTPTVNAPIEKVQTGGFGDPNGLKGTGKQGAKLYAASMGSFDMPAGPGQGNGSGGAKGIKGTVASADFGSGVATPGKGDGRSNGHGISTGGFGAQQVAQGQGPKIIAQTGPATTPVEYWMISSWTADRAVWPDDDRPEFESSVHSKWCWDYHEQQYCICQTQQYAFGSR